MVSLTPETIETFASVVIRILKAITECKVKIMLLLKG